MTSDIRAGLMELRERLAVLEQMLRTYSQTLHATDQPDVVAHLESEIAGLRRQIAAAAEQGIESTPAQGRL
jgi:hypothetical protein